MLHVRNGNNGAFEKVLLRNHVIFLGAFAIISVTDFYFWTFQLLPCVCVCVCVCFSFFTIINSAAKESIWQEVQSGGSLTQRDGGGGSGQGHSQPVVTLKRGGWEISADPLLPPVSPASCQGCLLVRKGAQFFRAVCSGAPDVHTWCSACTHQPR